MGKEVIVGPNLPPETFILRDGEVFITPCPQCLQDGKEIIKDTMSSKRAGRLIFHQGEIKTQCSTCEATGILHSQLQKDWLNGKIPPLSWPY